MELIYYTYEYEDKSLTPHFTLYELMGLDKQNVTLQRPPSIVLPEEHEERLRLSSKLDIKTVHDNLYHLAHSLEMFRCIVDKPITINSGFRTTEHNKKVGGSPNSYHLQGMAADIVVKGMAASEVQALLHNWSGGLGSYKNFTHIDIGPKRRW